MTTEEGTTEEGTTTEETPAESKTAQGGSEGGTTEEAFDEARAKAKIAKVNSEAASLRQRLKDAEDKVRKHEDAGKSEAEREKDKVKSLEDRTSNAERELVRLRVAIKKGLTESQAKRLVGDTEEELEADADELLETFGKPKEKEKGSPGGKPKEKLSGGGDPTEEPEETDPRKLAGKIRRR